MKKNRFILISLFLLSSIVAFGQDETVGDTVKSVRYWKITERTGEIIPGNPDTLLSDLPNRSLVEGQSVSMAYLGNLGLPMESRVYFDRKDRSNFMFFDPYYNYSRALEKHNFKNTRVPNSNATYLSAGSQNNKEERLLADLSVNFGKNLNVGLDVDYLYARGLYQSQSAKHLEWDFYTSYISDRHQLHAFINPADYISAENGGIQNDLYITNPDAVETEAFQTDGIPVNFSNVWNKIKGTRYYLNYHYNLGFERTRVDSLRGGEEITEFVPVSSIIYTFDFVNRKRSFYSKDSISGIDNFYNNQNFLNYQELLHDSTSYSSLRNTLGLSLREGFSSWAKFDLTAFITQDIRKYTLMAKDSTSSDKYDQSTTYIGGEIAKRTGKILSYNAQGEFGIIGVDNLGDIKLSGNIQTRIPIFNDTAAIQINGYFKNVAPTLYENHYHGKYLWWDEDFDKTKKMYVGGTINIPHTLTNFSLGVENNNDYLYFDKTGYPKQYSGSIQILAATLQQNVKLGNLHWDNQLVYQTSSNQDVIPLPDISLYSNLYFQFKLVKVLTFQLGGNVHYFTKYYSPTYEPVTQQFRLQDEVKVGNYPLVNAYINCNLKQARFFVEFYNLSSKFINSPAYFSLPHYPVNPMMFKLGISTYFNN